MKYHWLINWRNVLTLILIAISSTLFAQKTQKQSHSYNDIKRLVSMKQKGEAVLVCQSILEDKPNYYDVRVYLGRIYSAISELAQKIYVFNTRYALFWYI